MKRMFLVAAALLAGSTSTSATSAAPGWREDGTATEVISFGDLNLQSAADQKLLKKRVEFAAYRLCLADSGSTSSTEITDRECLRAALGSGMQQMQLAVARAMDSQASLSTTAPRH